MCMVCGVPCQVCPLAGKKGSFNPQLSSFQPAPTGVQGCAPRRCSAGGFRQCRPGRVRSAQHRPRMRSSQTLRARQGVQGWRSLVRIGCEGGRKHRPIAPSKASSSATVSVPQVLPGWLGGLEGSESLEGRDGRVSEGVHTLLVECLSSAPMGAGQRTGGAVRWRRRGAVAAIAPLAVAPVIAPMVVVVSAGRKGRVSRSAEAVPAHAPGTGHWANWGTTAGHNQAQSTCP